MVKFRPKDKDAKMKYTECKKIVQRQAFEKAIAVDHQKKSVADSLDIDSMGKHSILVNSVLPSVNKVMSTVRNCSGHPDEMNQQFLAQIFS